MSKRLKITSWVLLGILVVVTIVALTVRHWANRPVSGTIRTGAPIAQDYAAETPETPVDIQTEYFTAQLKGGFKITRQITTPSGQTRLQLVANSEHQQFAITIAELPSVGLSGVGSYNLRTTDRNSYEPYRPAGLPIVVTAFRALNDPPAFVAFWPNGSLYAEVALTSDGAASLSDLFNTFIQTTPTWEWR